MDKRTRRRTGKKKAEPKIKTMDLILVILAVATFLFTVKMISLFQVYGSIPDTLVERYFTTVVGECGIMGVITAVKVRHSGDSKEETPDEPEEEITDDGPGQG